MGFLEILKAFLEVVHQLHLLGVEGGLKISPGFHREPGCRLVGRERGGKSGGGGGDSGGGGGVGRYAVGVSYF